MKTLKLKKIGEFDYREIIEGILKNAPIQGFSIDEVRKSVKALDALEQAKEEVQWEDDIASHVKKITKETKFRVASKEVVELLDDIEKM